MAKPQDIILSKKEIANLFGVTVQAFDKWNITSVGTKSGTKYYDLKQVISYKLEVEKRRGSNSSTNRSRLLLAQAESAELKLAEQKGELLPSVEVVDVWNQQIINIKSKLLGLPTRLAKMLSTIAKPFEIEKVLKEYVYEVLNELSEFKPKKYDNTKTRAIEPAIKATSRPDNKRVGRQKQGSK